MLRQSQPNIQHRCTVSWVDTPVCQSYDFPQQVLEMEEQLKFSDMFLLIKENLKADLTSELFTT